jgi:endonuclease/exonuclease/phosphatase family metal-dependent hydrolase
MEAGTLTVATFNVKDLFDAGFAAKIRELARHIDRARADVVALQEIGSEGALDALVSALAKRADYKYRLVGTPDRRGIRNVILSALPFERAVVHQRPALPFPVFTPGDSEPFGARIPLRRGVPEVTVAHPALGKVTVLSVHLKSKRPQAPKGASGEELPIATPHDLASAEVRSLVSRLAEALFVRGLVDGVTAREGEVVCAGDLNDTAESLPVGLIRGKGPGALVSAAQGLSEAERVSALHGAPAQIDHLLVSPGLAARLVEARVFNEDLREHAHVEDAPPTADSDHALFMARFA